MHLGLGPRKWLGSLVIAGDESIDVLAEGCDRCTGEILE